MPSRSSSVNETDSCESNEPFEDFMASAPAQLAVYPKSDSPTHDWRSWTHKWHEFVKLLERGSPDYLNEIRPKLVIVVSYIRSHLEHFPKMQSWEWVQKLLEKYTEEKSPNDIHTTSGRSNSVASPSPPSGSTRTGSRKEVNFGTSRNSDDDNATQSHGRTSAECPASRGKVMVKRKRVVPAPRTILIMPEAKYRASRIRRSDVLQEHGDKQPERDKCKPCQDSRLYSFCVFPASNPTGKCLSCVYEKRPCELAGLPFAKQRDAYLHSRSASEDEDEPNTRPPYSLKRRADPAPVTNGSKRIRLGRGSPVSGLSVSDRPAEISARSGKDARAKKNSAVPRANTQPVDTDPHRSSSSSSASTKSSALTQMIDSGYLSSLSLTEVIRDSERLMNELREVRDKVEREIGYREGYQKGWQDAEKRRDRT